MTAIPSILRAAAQLAAGELSARELAQRCLANAEAARWSNAYVDLMPEETILDAAARSDERRARGASLGALDGIPIAVKDNICVIGLGTTAGSEALRDYKSPFNATAVERLVAAGAIIMGKTNMDEFGMGSFGLYSRFGATRNPRYPSLVAGGSSSGSAAAVASGACLAALGSDTGGSVRLPAAFCGVVGLKPSYGRVPRWGLVAYASSLDTIGVFSRTVTDAALVLDAISGPDERDVTSLVAAKEGAAEPCFTAAVSASSPPPLSREVTVGVPSEFSVLELGPEARQAWRAAASQLESAGATLVKPSALPSVRHALPAYYVIAAAEASSNLAKYDGLRYGTRLDVPGKDGIASSALHASYARTRTVCLGGEVQRRILAGAHVLSSSFVEQYYAAAIEVRRSLSRELESAFRDADVLLVPTTPALPPDFEREHMKNSSEDRDVVRAFVYDAMTVPASLCGLPAISVPIDSGAVLSQELPHAVQLVAPKGAEAKMLHVARLLENDLNL